MVHFPPLYFCGPKTAWSQISCRLLHYIYASMLPSIFAFLLSSFFFPFIHILHCYINIYYSSFKTVTLFFILTVTLFVSHSLSFIHSFNLAQRYLHIFSPNPYNQK